MELAKREGRLLNGEIIIDEIPRASLEDVVDSRLATKVPEEAIVGLIDYVRDPDGEMPVRRSINPESDRLCPYTGKECQYVVVPGSEERGLQIREIIDSGVPPVVEKDGRTYCLPMPTEEDFCETCESSPAGRRPCISYLAEALTEVLG